MRPILHGQLLVVKQGAQHEYEVRHGVEALDEAPIDVVLQDLVVVLDEDREPTQQEQNDGHH